MGTAERHREPDLLWHHGSGNLPELLERAPKREHSCPPGSFLVLVSGAVSSANSRAIKDLQPFLCRVSFLGLDRCVLRCCRNIFFFSC